jgi:hypothetical protein
VALARLVWWVRFGVLVAVFVAVDELGVAVAVVLVLKLIGALCAPVAVPLAQAVMPRPAVSAEAAMRAVLVRG